MNDSVEQIIVGITTLNTELQAMQNLPAIQGAGAIATALEQLSAQTKAFSNQQTAMNTHITAELTALRTEVAVIKTEVAVIKTEVADIKTEITGIKTEMKSVQHNAVARSINGSLQRLTSRLTPLHSSNDVEFENFPQNQIALDALDGNALEALLNSFGLLAGGTLGEKRSRVRAFIGLGPVLGH
ncbi:MAG: hypothetical protein M1829_004762 [Trizodia sp. TS-e1964]|nr:MAG: hypothetical protein M1829_004762 [Trizodia sp. TS-e1964]